MKSEKILNIKAASAQLPLFGHFDEQAIRTHLQKGARGSKSIALTLTNNSFSVLSVREKAGVVHVRLHRMFLHANTAVLDEISCFIREKKGSTPLIRAFIKSNAGRLGKRPPRKVTLCTQGKHHDLKQLFDEINQEYFSGRLCPSLTWGSRPPARSARKFTLGSFSASTDTIRINPMLDRKSVPEYFVAFVLFHEMLHADMDRPAPAKGKKRIVHCREFKRRERLFRHYVRATAWENKKWAGD